MTRPLVRGVFALLVLATIAAFFVTQQLKSEFPLVIRFAAGPPVFSPNGDDHRDSTVVGFDLSEPAEVTFAITDGEGNEVRRVVDERRLAGDRKYRFRWNGRDDDGRVVRDGIYRMRVVRRDESRVINSIKEITVDTTPPEVELLDARPSLIAMGEPGGSQQVRIRYRGPVNAAPEFRVFRTDDGPPRVVRRFRGDHRRGGDWGGEVAAGPHATRPAPDGIYAFTVTVRDRAGNLAVAPTEIPTPQQARPGTGVSVRRFTLRGPLEVVRAGSIAELEVGPFDHSFEFVVSRLGAPEDVVRRGGGIGGPFRVSIGRSARTGVYLVRVRAGDRRAVWPLAVKGRRESDRPRPLVVLPTMSWQGLNPVDDDADGFADTLPAGGPVRLDRYFADGGLPPRFGRGAPLLEYLDRAALPYDLTTDVALARGEGSGLEDAGGVAFAGSALWLPDGLLQRLRDYVMDGGRMASFGADALRRSVRLGGETLSDPSPRRPRDAFGERTELASGGRSPLEVLQDDLGLFEGLTSPIGHFTEFELSLGLVPDAERAAVAAAGGGDQPAFVAYELGDGLVVRSGTPQWARELDEARLAVEVPQVTNRIWRLLSGGGSG
jgi:FlgD Ig-like domain